MGPDAVKFFFGFRHQIVHYLPHGHLTVDQSHRLTFHERTVIGKIAVVDPGQRDIKPQAARPSIDLLRVGVVLH